MNTIADIQSSRDLRNLSINQAGTKDLRFPISLKSREGEQSAVTRLTMMVFLPAGQKDMHMSRFATLMEKRTDTLDFDTLHKLTADIVALLDSHPGKISMSFPFFRKESAPTSGIQSLLDYDATLTGEARNGTYNHNLKAVVPVTSLCPYSKEISQYGAHNQHSHATVNLVTNADVGTKEVIGYVGAQANCQLYGLLERPDEKYITEKAYKNPKFVKDMVCNVATVLIADKRIESFVVESENFESIHDHSAYVYIAYP